jgi:mono/diheme cytochrome c family protein
MTAARKAGAAERTVAMLSLAAVAAGAWAAGDDAARARRNYTHHCVGCHMADGSGAPHRGIPTMRGQLGRFLLVSGGREFIVQVPGVMHTPLKDAEVAELMNWLLHEVSSQTLPPGTQPYTEAEIRQLRRSRPADIPGARAQLVRQLAERGITIE